MLLCVCGVVPFLTTIQYVRVYVYVRQDQGERERERGRAKKKDEMEKNIFVNLKSSHPILAEKLAHPSSPLGPPYPQKKDT